MSTSTRSTRPTVNRPKPRKSRRDRTARNPNLGLETLEDRVLLSADPFVLAAEHGQVSVLDPAGALRFSIDPYGAAYTGAVHAAAGRLTGAAAPDIVTGTGVGAAPHVQVFSGADGSVVHSFLAFDAAFEGGVHVAAADLTGDGVDDLVTAAGAGGGPAVSLWDGATGAALGAFFAYDPAFTGGVHVAAADLTGDGIADIVTGAGEGGGPHVRVFDGTTLGQVAEFFAYSPSFTGGVHVAAGDVNGDGAAEIITGAGAGGGSHVRVFGGAGGAPLGEFFAGDPSLRGGVSVAAVDTDGDGTAEVVTAAGGRVRVHAGPGGGELASFALPEGRGDPEVAGFAGTLLSEESSDSGTALAKERGGNGSPGNGRPGNGRPPTATFTATGDVTEGSAGAVTFTDVRLGPGNTAVSYSYDFDNDGVFEIAGTDSPSAEVPARYLADGPAERVVRGRVTGWGGRYSEYTATITVSNAAPVVAAPGDQAVPAGTAAEIALGSFTDPGPDAPWRVRVDWGDGRSESFTTNAPGALAGRSHAYAAPGTYTATVTVTDADGAAGSGSFTVRSDAAGTEAPPVIDSFDVPATANEGEAVPLRAAATDPAAAGALSYAWTVTGPGYTFRSTGATSAFRPVDEGDYAVELTVTTPDGRTAFASGTVRVANVAPSVTAPAAQSAGEGVAAQFALGSFADPGDDAPWQVTVNWGDGKVETFTADAAGPLGGRAHAYAAPGTYTATVTVTDADGAAGSGSFAVSVTDLALSISSLDVPATATEGSAVRLRAQANDPAQSGTLSYAWSVSGPGYSSTLSGPDVTFQPPDNGDYSVRLTVSAADGRTATATRTVAVSNVAPTVNPGGPYAAMAGMAVQFAGSATDPGPRDTAAGLNYRWEFGDGTTAAVANPTHTYSAAGTYLARLTVTDKDGGSASRTATVTVSSMHSGHSEVTVTADYITTHHDRIPNFGGRPTIASTRSGKWSDPATWGGRVPGPLDVVSIGAGTVVTYDVAPSASNPALDTVVIQSGGSLRFRTDVSTQLRVVNLLVLPGGELTVGTAADPVRPGVTATVSFPDVPLDLAADPAQYGNGLIAFGKVTVHGAAMSDTFVRLAAEPRAGDTVLRLSEPVVGWRPGDRLILPDTRQMRADAQHETLTIASVSADGRSVTLTAPLQYDHLGARDADGTLRFLPHVGNTKRNVVFRSENALGTRGHTFFGGRAEVDIRYAQFAGLGRTRNETLDDTTFDASGNVTHVGTNQTARYPVHFHHLYGPTATPANGYQFTFEGNSVTCPVDPMPYRWGITVHDSHFGLIRGNVLYNWAGSGIVLEGGNETGNVVEGNFIVRVSGNGNRGDGKPLGSEGTGIWLHGPNNYIRDNVVANARMYGANLIVNTSQSLMAPLFPGANPMLPGQGEPIGYDPVLEFARNEAYASLIGLTVWFLGASYTTTVPDMPQSVLKDFHGWHLYDKGAYFYPTSNVLLDGWVLRNDSDLLRKGIPGGTGLYTGDYLTRDMVVRNADIQGFGGGIAAPPKAGSTAESGTEFRTFIVEGGTLINRVNVTVESPYAVTGGGWGLPPRRIEIRNVAFGAVAGTSHLDIRTLYIWATKPNVLAPTEIYVYGFNRNPADNFRVYFAEQAPDFVVPLGTNEAPDVLTTGFSVGTPSNEGEPRTNQYLWDTYGVAVAGSLLPSDAVRRDGIGGLVRPL